MGAISWEKSTFGWGPLVEADVITRSAHGLKTILPKATLLNRIFEWYHGQRPIYGRMAEETSDTNISTAIRAKNLPSTHIIETFLY